MAERLIGRDQCARLELDWPQLRGSVIFPPMDSKERLSAALVVAVTTYVVFAVVGVPGLGLWILTNVLLGLLILFGGQFVRDRQRRSLDQERAELSALAPTPDDDSLLMGTKDPEVGY